MTPETAPKRTYARLTCLCGRTFGSNVLRQHRARCRAQLQLGERPEDEEKLLAQTCKKRRQSTC